MRGTKYDRLVWRFYSLQKRGMKLSLDGTKALLRKLGNPEKHFSSVLVAGTNGKGSTSSLIASALKASGHRVGLYTSPHLVDFRERVRVSGECIREAEAHDLLSFLVPVAEMSGNSFFEAITALAFRHFRDRSAELVVAEVGLGGRLDSTNVLDPLVSVITGISMEHSEILGSTLRAIAVEKAGILRKNRSVVTAACGPALAAIRRAADSLGSPLFVVGEDLELRARFLSRAGSVFSAAFRGKAAAERDWPDLYLRLRGRHQIRNAGCALLACSRLRRNGFRIGDEAIESGFRNVEWPGRLDERGVKPLILLDVAHNPEAGAVLRNSLETLYKDKKVTAVIGMVQDKDHTEFLRRLLPAVSRVVFTQASTPRALPAHELRQRAGKRYSRSTVKQRVCDAVEEALSVTGDDELVCVTGSFYTVGEAMNFLGIDVAERI